jgi:hypothetical protein
MLRKLILQSCIANPAIPPDFGFFTQAILAMDTWFQGFP